jgi:hypothetical protein
MQGTLRKLRVEAQTSVAYYLPIGADELPINRLLGQSLSLTFCGNIYCISCGRATKKSFNQGYCYPCSQRLAECDICIVRPERCHYHLGTCREPAWGDEHCFQPHIVYLANSSGLKVGITRQRQIPTRWIDQGAIQALPIFRVNSRYLSGLIEITLAQHVADKTHWQRLLKGEPAAQDLPQRWAELRATAKAELAAVGEKFAPDAIAELDEAVHSFVYPVQTYPAKVKAHNFDKTPTVSGILQGIKGQYLIFDNGVLNIRKFTGYEVRLE